MVKTQDFDSCDGGSTPPSPVNNKGIATFVWVATKELWILKCISV